MAAAGLAVAGVALRAPATPDPAVVALPSPTASPMPTASPTAPVATPAAAVPGPHGTARPHGVLDPGLELAVLAAARTTMGTAGLPLPGPAPDSWPLETRVTAVTPSGDDVAVVTVLALVIDRREEGWSAPTTRAVAIPVRLEPPAVLGAAWPVRVTPVPVRAPQGRTITEGDPAVVAALEVAGWSVASVTAVAEVGDHHLQVELRGTPPGRATAAVHTVWLREDPGGPVALPDAADPTTTTSTQDPDPATEETP